MMDRRGRSRDRFTVVLVSLYAVMWVGGVASYILRGDVQEHERWTASAFLALAGLIVLRSERPQARRLLVIAALLGLAAEWLGVRGGWLFGEYHYTDRLRPQLGGVPIVMASAWLVLVAYVRTLTARLTRLSAAQIVLSAAWLTAIDLVLDPVAAGPLGYWTWSEAGDFYGIPLHNFLGWFVVGLVVFSVVRLLERVWSSRWTSERDGLLTAAPDSPGWGRAVGSSVVLFFSILALAFGLVLPAVIGVLLSVIDLTLALRDRGRA